MKCADFEANALACVDDAGDPALTARLRLHADACARCATVQRRLHGVVRLLGALEPEPMPDTLPARVLAGPRPGRHEPRPGATRSRRPLRRVAGWAMVLIGIGWQAGAGALAGRAMSTAAPVLADARQAYEKVRRTDIVSEVGRTGAGVVEIARGLRDVGAAGAPHAPDRKDMP